MSFFKKHEEKTRKYTNKEYAKGQIKSTIAAIIVALIASCLLLYFLGINKYIDYMKHKDIVVPVNAEVTYIHEYEDSDDDDHYETYISYTYNHIEHKKVFWDDFSSKEYNIGDIVTVKIDPNNPTYILDNDAGVFGFAVAIVIFSIAIYQALILIHNPEKKPHDNKLIITDAMIAYDLRPWYLSSPALFLICVGTGLITGHNLMPIAFNKTCLVIGIICLIIGIIFQIISTCIVLKMPNNHYNLNVHTCTKKWSDNDGETTTYYTNFSGIDKPISGNIALKAFLGINYYIVRNQNGTVREIYPCTLWHPEIEDRTLVQGSRAVIKRLWLDLFFGIIVMALFTSAISAVSNLLI